MRQCNVCNVNTEDQWCFNCGSYTYPVVECNNCRKKAVSYRLWDWRCTDCASDEQIPMRRILFISHKKNKPTSVFMTTGNCPIDDTSRPTYTLICGKPLSIEEMRDATQNENVYMYEITNKNEYKDLEKDFPEVFSIVDELY